MNADLDHLRSAQAEQGWCILPQALEPARLSRLLALTDRWSTRSIGSPSLGGSVYPPAMSCRSFPRSSAMAEPDAGRLYPPCLGPRRGWSGSCSLISHPSKPGTSPGTKIC